MVCDSNDSFISNTTHNGYSMPSSASESVAKLKLAIADIITASATLAANLGSGLPFWNYDFVGI